jgi:ParB family transcriptional regulator, chromosome partitioning protein
VHERRDHISFWKEAYVNCEQTQEISIDLIDTEPQVREKFDEASLTQLSKQIARHGLLQAILLRRVGTRYKVVFGGRRFLAAKMAGCRTIRARVIDRELDAGDIALLQLIENSHEDLNPMERARGIAMAMAGKEMTASQLVTELGDSSDSSVSNALALLKLPKPIQDLVENGSIAASAASRLASIEDAEQQAELARQLAEGKLTRDGLCGAMKARRKASKKEGKPGPSRATAELGSGRKVTVWRAGLDMEAFIETLEELIAKARKVRTRGIGLSTFLKILRDEGKSVSETSE